MLSSPYLTACRIMESSILYFVESIDYDTHNSCHGKSVDSYKVSLCNQPVATYPPSRRGTLVDNCFLCVYCRINLWRHMCLRCGTLGWKPLCAFCRINLSPHTCRCCDTPVENCFMFCSINLSRLTYVHFAARRLVTAVYVALTIHRRNSVLVLSLVREPYFADA